MAEQLEATTGGSLSIFITGGDTGAGVAVVREATKNGYKAYATAAKGTLGATRIRRAGGIPVYPDLTRESALRAAILMAKADVVVNCAPQRFFGMPQHAIDYNATAHLIEEETEALVAAAGSMGIKRLVHLSSAFLYGETHGAANEEAHVHRGNALLNAAAAAEEAVFDGGVPGHVVRAGVIYGGYHDSMAALAEDLRSGSGIPGGKGKVSWIHENDLGTALANLAVIKLENESVANVLNIADDEPMTYDDFMAEFGKRFGVGTPSRLSGIRAAFRTNAIQLELLGQSTLVDNSLAKATLGWVPKVASKEEGIERSMLIWRAEEAENMPSSSRVLVTT